MDEEGIKILDPELSKEHIAKYFETLYQARKAEKEYIQSTEEIEEQVNKWAEEESYNQNQAPISMNELNKVIKKLKNGKSNGPDNIPNEIFTRANTNTKNIYLRIFNNILQSQEIPEIWQAGVITRLYKGKAQMKGELQWQAI